MFVCALQLIGFAQSGAFGALSPFIVRQLCALLVDIICFGITFILRFRCLGVLGCYLQYIINSLPSDRDHE